MNKKILFCGILLSFVLSTQIASAHEPRLVWKLNNSSNTPIVIENPDISQAFYGEFKSTPEYYKVKINEPSVLYLSLLVPDNNHSAINVSAKVIKLNSADSNIKISLDGTKTVWESYYEPFAGDFYLQGPEASEFVRPGEYLITVTSDNNLGKYTLVIGQKESFPLDEAVKTILNLPRLKLDFFEEPIYMLTAGILGKIMASLFLFLLLLILMSLRKVRESKRY
jgi:hypothetical protein